LVFGDFQDVVGKIFAFYQKGPSSAVCILSANGTISSVTLRQPGVSDGFLTYEVQLYKQLISSYKYKYIRKMLATHVNTQTHSL
jgi:hypothetical protein